LGPSASVPLRHPCVNPNRLRRPGMTGCKYEYLARESPNPSFRTANGRAGIQARGPAGSLNLRNSPRPRHWIPGSPAAPRNDGVRTGFRSVGAQRKRALATPLRKSQPPAAPRNDEPCGQSPPVIPAHAGIQARQRAPTHGPGAPPRHRKCSRMTLPRFDVHLVIQR
jgi:hypothetical protein